MHAFAGMSGAGFTRHSLILHTATLAMRAREKPQICSQPITHRHGLLLRHVTNLRRHRSE